MLIAADFGTSFSQAAAVSFSQPVLLQDPGEYGTPSVFYYDQDTGIAVGQEAIDCGQGAQSVNMKTDVKMELINNQPFTADGTPFSCEEIVSEIYKSVLNKAKRVAEAKGIGSTIDGLVITVPAKFGYLERDIIINSAWNALGDKAIPITGVLKEPVAAALHYFHTNVEDGKNILVFDLGGGTCDIALVRANSQLREYYDVIDSEMERVGGRDWDDKICAYLRDVVKERTGINVAGNPAYERKIRDAAVKAKHRLSDQEKAICRLEVNFDILSIPLTLEKFNELTAEPLSRAVSALKRVYDRNVSDYEIDDIICVGGSSNMKQIKERIQADFPYCSVRLYNPEYAVVSGAALYADMRGLNVIDKADFSYGIQVVEHKGTPQEKYQIQNMLIKGAVLPFDSTRSYRPSEDNQATIVFRVYETDTTLDHCDMDEYPMTKIGELKLILPANTPHTTDVRTKMTLDKDGVLKVQAWDLEGNDIHAEFSVLRSHE